MKYCRNKGYGNVLTEIGVVVQRYSLTNYKLQKVWICA